jgi:hypothetical protein
VTNLIVPAEGRRPENGGTQNGGVTTKVPTIHTSAAASSHYC